MYSSLGQLLQVDTAEHSIECRHNALGQRVAKLVNGQVTEKYLWRDLITLLATYDANGNVKQRFEHTLGHTPTSFTQNGQRYFIQSDHLGSPRVITDSSGNVVKTIDYDSYGNIIHDSNESFEIPFGFAGGLYDKHTGLIRFGFKDYDPQTGRWTARDPIGFAGGDTNLYGYVSNNPVRFIDPSGLMFIYAFPNDTGQEFRYEFEFKPLHENAGDILKYLHNFLRRMDRLGDILGRILYPEGAGPNDADWRNPSRMYECGVLDAKLKELYERMFGDRKRLTRDEAKRFLDAALFGNKNFRKFYDSPDELLNKADQNARNHWWNELFYPNL